MSRRPADVAPVTGDSPRRELEGRQVPPCRPDSRRAPCERRSLDYRERWRRRGAPPHRVLVEPEAVVFFGFMVVCSLCWIGRTPVGSGLSASGESAGASCGVAVIQHPSVLFRVPGRRSERGGEPVEVAPWIGIYRVFPRHRGRSARAPSERTANSETGGEFAQRDRRRNPADHCSQRTRAGPAGELETATLITRLATIAAVPHALTG